MNENRKHYSFFTRLLLLCLRRGTRNEVKQAKGLLDKLAKILHL